MDHAWGIMSAHWCILRIIEKHSFNNYLPIDLLWILLFLRWFNNLNNHYIGYLAGIVFFQIEITTSARKSKRNLLFPHTHTHTHIREIVWEFINIFVIIYRERRIYNCISIGNVKNYCRDQLVLEDWAY